MYCAIWVAALFTGLAYQLGMQKSPSGTLPTVQETADMVAAQFPCESDAIRELCERLVLTKGQVGILEQQTKVQATSATWKEQRRGRITGSKCKAVSSKVDELIRNKDTVFTPLVHSLMTDGKGMSEIPAVKWGIIYEKDAIQALVKVEFAKHRNFVVKPAVRKTESFYIAASPDGLASCECHGYAAVECKCPFSIKGERISGAYKKPISSKKEANR
ncbi:hypothetical protein HOLleu_22293 [Holothuria leucospilota]|uniref:YqaJ viral recombinase domain-containing protein n=1 Tax=Holothuria leucospilota TaxID=206669 RepID=A0A9Q1H6N6_HOLLE|nr:hypothetical protein HOLleu_22293 [Holothuria leucospilota]